MTWTNTLLCHLVPTLQHLYREEIVTELTLFSWSRESFLCHTHSLTFDQSRSLIQSMGATQEWTNYARHTTVYFNKHVSLVFHLKLNKMAKTLNGETPPTSLLVPTTLLLPLT